ncbi:MAG: glycosyltransferase family 4 protein [Myxococcales bacterium]
MAPAIAIDLRMVGARPHGIARYAQALWERLPEQPGIRYLGLLGAHSPIRPCRPSDRLVRCRAPFLSPLEQAELPWLLGRERAALLHATSFSVPAAWRGPLVLTLHDVNHLALPGWSGAGRTPYYRRVVGPAAARAARVLTPSDFSAGEIERWLGVPRERLRVAPNAVDGRFVRPPEAEIQRFVSRAGLPASYVLYLGSHRPHKNASLVFEVARRIAVPIVVAGRGLSSRPDSPARVLPDLPDEELPALYAGAALLLFPSYHEGFGLPPLEAAACGTPVLVARGSALDEIWSGVTEPLPPDQPGRWVAAIEGLLADRERRRALAEACSRRAERFRSWGPAVDAAVDAYRAALAPP